MPVNQSSRYLTQLLREVEAGKLVPASFQRPYVWAKADVEAFWESLLLGYPVGSFLTWTPSSDVDLSALGRSRIGPVLVDRGRGCSLVLDGQNRLASFAWSLADLAGQAGLGPVDDDLSPMERETWHSGEFLAADPEDRTIRFRPRGEAADRLLVPAAILAQSSRLMPFLRRYERQFGEVPDAHVDWLADEAERRISEAKVVVTDLERMSPDEALHAFRHIARTGVPMSDQDFEAAFDFVLPDRTSAPSP